MNCYHCKLKDKSVGYLEINSEAMAFRITSESRPLSFSELISKDIYFDLFKMFIKDQPLIYHSIYANEFWILITPKYIEFKSNTHETIGSAIDRLKYLFD